MSAPVEIRFATAEDSATLHRLIVELAVYEREPDAVEATPASLGEQMRETSPPFECLLAELDGDTVGMALFFHNYSTWTGKRGLYLEDLFVVPGARGRGVGLALFRRLARIARDRDCARFEWAVLDWNEPALAFYERVGARSLDEWRVHRLAGPALDELARSDG